MLRCNLPVLISLYQSIYIYLSRQRKSKIYDENPLWRRNPATGQSSCSSIYLSINVFISPGRRNLRPTTRTPRGEETLLRGNLSVPLDRGPTLPTQDCGGGAPISQGIAEKTIEILLVLIDMFCCETDKLSYHRKIQLVENVRLLTRQGWRKRP